MGKPSPSLERELLRACGGFSSFWWLNILFQLLFIPTSAALFLFKQTNIGFILFSLWSVPLFVSMGQTLFHRFRLRPLLSQWEEGEFIGKLRRCLFINLFCFIPLFGLCTSFSGAKAHCLLDELRWGKGDAFVIWKRTCRRCLVSLWITHVICILFGNAFWILLAFHDTHQVYMPSFITFIFISIWGLVSGLINMAFSSHNINTSYKVRGGEDVQRHMKGWRRSLKSNFIVYIPLLGVFAMIPFFISQVIFKDLDMEGGDYRRQYIKKCKAFLHIVVWGSFISLPYLVCISILGKWHNNSWLVIPLALNLLATSILNFVLCCDQEVYADLFLSKEEQGEDVKRITLMSRLCAGLIIFTVFSALPAIILLLKYLRAYGKRETVLENKISESLPEVVG